MSIIVPEAILEAVEEAAKRRDLSISEFVENTLLAKASEVLSAPYLESRAKRANGLGWRKNRAIGSKPIFRGMLWRRRIWGSLRKPEVTGNK